MNRSGPTACGPNVDHYEGRSFGGWHHHVTLVAVGHGFLSLERLCPARTRRHRPDVVKLLGELQVLLAC